MPEFFRIFSGKTKVEECLRNNAKEYNKLLAEYERLEAEERTELSMEERKALWVKKQKNFDRRKLLEKEQQELREKNPM